MRLTDRTVANLKWEGKQQLVHDDLIPGFSVRVGQKWHSFVLTLPTGDRKRITLGRYPILSLSQARQRARDIIIMGPEPQRHAPTFKEVLDEFLDGRQVRRSTAQKDGYTAKCLSSLYEYEAPALTPEVVQRVIEAQSSPWSKHYACRLFVLTVKYAQKKGMMENWPLQRIGAKLIAKPRERVLTEQELSRALQCAHIWSTSNHPYGNIITLLCLTGQRRQQIASLRREQIDLDNRLIHWQASDMKNGRAHSIPISNWTSGFLASMTPSGKLFFPSSSGSAFTAFSMYADAFKRDCGFSDWTLHDLRRTYATIHAELGTPLHIIEKLLSHSYSQLTAVGSVYMRYSFLKEAREAVEKYEAHLLALMGQE